MTERLATWLWVTGILLLVGGCGSDSSSTSDGAALSFRIAWPAALQGGTTDPAPFGSPIPPAVARLAVAVTAGGEHICCVKFDPRDSRFSDRSLSITGLPEGLASVTVSASASSEVAGGAAAPLCPVAQPDGVGELCDDSPCASVSLSYEATADVSLARGRSTTPDLHPTSQPFLFGLDPACGALARANPAPLTFVVADADASCTCVEGRLQCAGQTITLDQSEGSAPAIEVFDEAPVDGLCENAVRSAGGRSLRITSGAVRCCRDDDACRANETCCTPAGTALAGVTGLQTSLVTAEPLLLGCGELQVHAAVLGGGGAQSGAFSAAYAFAVPSPPPATPTPIPTLSPTPPPTPTVTRGQFSPGGRKTPGVPGTP